MKKLFLFVAILFFQCAPRIYPTQTSSIFKDKYADQLEPGSVLLKSWYHFTVEQLPDGGYVEKIFYPDTKTLTHFTTYKDESISVKNGKYKDFWDDGEPISEGNYINNKREGEWTSFTGKFASKGQYSNNEKTGLWVTRDSVGNKTAEYNYQNGKLHGAFKKWEPDGTLVHEGNYVDGEIGWEKKYKDGAETSSLTGEEVLKVVETQPYFKSPNCTNITPDELRMCRETEMLKFIYSNIKYPAKAREMGLQGMVIVQFVVEKDGSISNVVSRRGICKEMKDECLRIVNSMSDKWSPGYQREKPVRVQFNLPVKFKLE